MKTYTYTTTTELDEENITDLMESALQGVTYWADDARFLTAPPVNKPNMPLSEALVAKQTIQIHDIERNKWYDLNLEKFLKGLALYGNQNWYDFDMYDCEKVVQLALFGELQYA